MPSPSLSNSHIPHCSLHSIFLPRQMQRAIALPLAWVRELRIRQLDWLGAILAREFPTAWTAACISQSDNEQILADHRLNVKTKKTPKNAKKITVAPRSSVPTLCAPSQCRLARPCHCTPRCCRSCPPPLCLHFGPVHRSIAKHQAFPLQKNGEILLE